MNKKDIEKLVYKKEFFDLSVMKIGSKLITTITDDGVIVVKEYRLGSRKAHSVKKAYCSLTAFETLCKSINECIETADRLDFYVDDSSEELRIYHKFGRVQIMDRGLGHENSSIGSIMNTFLEEYL
ncbi:MAG: hypothetical protein J6D52_04875 [Clostridia bacterium]|nr:hypothetical protein [Clostridia bacterium]